MENVPTMGHIKSQIRYGDYVLLGELLGITPDAAEKRLLRKDKGAIAAMLDIIEKKERLIKEYQFKNQGNER